MLFIVQGVFSLLALVFAWFVLVETARLKVRFDVLGSLLLAVSAGCLMFALGQVGELGLSSPWIWGAVVLSTVAVYGFVRVEKKTEEPLLPLRFFSYRNFTAPISSGALQNGAYMGAFVLAPFLLQNVFELTLVSTSLFMLLRTLTLTLTSPLGGVLGTRAGDRRASMIGTGTIMISMAVLATGASTGWILVVGAGLVLQGLGQGLCAPSLNAAVAGAVPSEHLGVATAAKNLFNQVVTAFGIALLAGLYAGEGGFQSAFFAGGVMAFLALCAAAFMKKDRPRVPGDL
jgi:predicted MFS family arabinose efflux permease